MIAHLPGGVRAHATPVHGEDFCDECGDCLSCYGVDECFYGPGGEHVWVVYENEVDDWREAHPDAEEWTPIRADS